MPPPNIILDPLLTFIHNRNCIGAHLVPSVEFHKFMPTGRVKAASRVRCINAFPDRECTHRTEANAKGGSKDGLTVAQRKER
jgi:hypothetical protein